MSLSSIFIVQNKNIPFPLSFKVKKAWLRCIALPYFDLLTQIHVITGCLLLLGKWQYIVTLQGTIIISMFMIIQSTLVPSMHKDCLAVAVWLVSTVYVRRLAFLLHQTEVQKTSHYGTYLGLYYSIHRMDGG